MDKRQKLQELLESLSVGKVYINAPPNTYMEYPCIIMETPLIDNMHASNETYVMRHATTFKYINPKFDISSIEKISTLSYCTHERNYIIDNLSHSVFKIYI